MLWRRLENLQELMTVGSWDASTSLHTTSVGKIRFGLGAAAVAGAPLRLNVRTMGWSLDTGSP